jgi:hypothetical protein
MIMVDLALLQTVSYIAGAIGVCVAAIYYILNLRVQQTNMKNTLETRQAQLFMNLYQHTYSADFGESMAVVLNKGVKDYADYVAMMEDPQRVKPYVVWGMWLEGQGVLVREGLISVRMVSELVGGMILMWWNVYSPYILRYRQEGHNPRHFIEGEYLCKRVAEYCIEHPELEIAVPDSVRY